MTSGDLELKISVTELPQFERLVRFASEVEGYAREESDPWARASLQQLVDDLRDDLAKMGD